MGILDKKEIITGIKPVEKNRPNLDRFVFDKKQPLGPYNFPMLSYAYYRIRGVRRDAAGIAHPVEFTKKLPCGQRIRFAKDDYPGIEITSCERIPYGPIL